MREYISIRGANEHNLKNIDVDIPRNKLVVITGLSGSGKSSLAFDTIYAEGQRRYVESLSAYARQFLGQMEKPDVEHIEGLSPAIAIDQKTTSKNPRSTVGTVTEIYDYLRLLYARVGIPHCPNCGKEITQQSIDQMVDKIMTLKDSSRILLLAPVVRGRKGEYTKQLDGYHKKGYARVRIDGEIFELGEPIKLERNIKHDIEVVIDRLVIREGMVKRLTDSLETALKLSEGLVMVQVVDGELLTFSSNYACEDCQISIEEVSPRSFSFNSPYGACPHCTGLGNVMTVSPDLIVPNKNLSLLNNAISVPGYTTKSATWFRNTLESMAEAYKFDLKLPYKKLPKRVRNILMNGSKKRFKVTYEQSYGSGTYMSTFEGLVNTVKRRHMQTQSGGMKKLYERLMTKLPCPECHGKRLRPEILAVTIGDLPISDITEMSVVDADKFIRSLNFTEKQMLIGEQILKEIHERLGFLINVGLNYLTLSRGAGTLSGGEAQRIRLATQVGSRLMGVLYILDEPSIGLHQRDNKRLLETLIGLRDLGNTLLVVEHDEETMRSADHIIDLGPGPGIHGGEIVAQGTADELMKNERSITGQYLSGKLSIHIPEQRRPQDKGHVVIKGAKQNNLKNINVSIPIGVLTCVTGVSGSGKSSLINEILYKSLAHQLNRAHTRPGLHKTIEGVFQLDKVIDIDQSPIGRTPRSNPATYTGMFSIIRELFANTSDSKIRGYKPGRFSFNVKGGRCEACRGDGIIKIEMHFLPDVYIPCEVCRGKRYSRETLDVRYKGNNISEVLNMTVEEALEFFQPIPRILRKVQTLYDVGLGYIKLGQPSTQLSGGEAQRVKLATELSKRSTGRTLYILDEPTTGLHSADVKKLVGILQQLTDTGNTVVVIEHNMDVIKTADYIIDMGPEGGDMGGSIIAKGTPEHVAKSKVSYTGKFLNRVLTKAD